MQSGTIEEFNELKPVLTEKQRNLHNSFIRVSNEREYSQGSPLGISERDIDYFINKYGCHGYAEDIFTNAILSLDSDYIQKKHAEIRKTHKG